MIEYPVRHLGTYRLTVVTRGSKVDAGKDSGVLHFIERLRKAPEGALHPDQKIVIHGEMRPFAEEAGEHSSCCAADGRVARGVFRMRRRRE